MDPFSAMLFALAVTWYGSRSGAVRAVRAVRDNHRQRKTSRPEPRPAPAGIRAGHAVSDGVTGSVLAVRDFRSGWRSGWVDGRDKARQRRDIRRDQHDARTLTVTPPTQDTPPAESRPLGEAIKDRAHQDWLRWTEATEPPEGRPAPVSLTKETPVMPATATAEVQSLPELIGFLEQIENDAQAELEDAQARETRAKKLASDIETVLGQLSTFELGNADLNVVGGLLDPTASAEKAATIAVEAAEHIHVMAQNAASVLLKRHQQMQEAADATPEPASMDFYKNGQNS